uniref:Putative vacuolar sorting protein vps33/slp1 sec1 family n=1 Tax=Lutzomyia longipalpis TaxID=7200 RepID=A0A1B0CP49_LUTLO
MFPHLSGWRVNIGQLQEACAKELLGILEKCEGTKAIIWDESLAGPVGLIAKYTFLKEHNVTKMFPLSGDPLPDIDVKSIIFITRPNLKLMSYIADNIHSEERKRKTTIKKDFHLYFLPKKSLLCEKHLKNKGVYGSLSHVGEFRCDFFPVDNDLLSMEIRDAFRELHIEGDPTCLHQSAVALVTLQRLYGRIPRVCGKGIYAEKLWELTKSLGRDDTQIGQGNEKGSIDQMVILDRSVDLMSVLATQLTYEGLIDEIFGISNTTLHLPADRFRRTDEQPLPALSTSETKQIILNSGEELYGEIRDKNFNAVGQILSRHANSISTALEERHGDKSVSAMKKFVERLPIMLAKKASLATHTTIAELIKEVTDSPTFLDELECEQEFLMCADVDRPSAFIEDLIAKQAPLRNVLRLICMQSLAGSGLKSKVLDYYKRELVQVYGLECLLTLSNLEKAGLLRPQTGNRSYAILRKMLNLTVDDAVEVSPKDISYVHSFYAPLSVRLIEHLLKPNGWQGLNDVLSCLPGPTFDDFQASPSSFGTRRGSFTSEISQSDIPRTILVFFLGGCTFAEVAALRFLAQQEENNVEFIIATTKLINKNTFLDCFIEKASTE